MSKAGFIDSAKYEKLKRKAKELQDVCIREELSPAAFEKSRAKTCSRSFVSLFLLR